MRVHTVKSDVKKDIAELARYDKALIQCTTMVHSGLDYDAPVKSCSLYLHTVIVVIKSIVVLIKYIFHLLCATGEMNHLFSY